MTLKELTEARKNYSKYCNELDKYQKELSNLKNTDKKLTVIKDLYSYVKDISLELYNNDENFEQNYFAISSSIFYCEKLLPKENIMQTKAEHHPNSIIEMSKENSSEAILNYIVNQARNFILNKARYQANPSLEKINLVAECIPTCNFIENICKNMNIKCQKIALYPGFMQDSTLFKGIKQHYFTIIQLKNEEYIVDCTYAQFFRLDRCILERLGIIRLSGCNAGIFMTMDETKKKVADKILKDGWIELTNETLKSYLDGFAISYRNGLYYEQTNDFTFTTDYTADDYRRFLSSDDNQLNYEKRKHLGIQMQPLQNPKLVLKK